MADMSERLPDTTAADELRERAEAGGSPSAAGAGNLPPLPQGTSAKIRDQPIDAAVDLDVSGEYIRTPPNETSFSPSANASSAANNGARRQIGGTFPTSSAAASSAANNNSEGDPSSSSSSPCHAGASKHPQLPAGAATTVNNQPCDSIYEIPDDNQEVATPQAVSSSPNTTATKHRPQPKSQQQHEQQRQREEGEDDDSNDDTTPPQRPMRSSVPGGSAVPAIPAGSNKAVRDQPVDLTADASDVSGGDSEGEVGTPRDEGNVRVALGNPYPYEASGAKKPDEGTLTKMLDGGRQPMQPNYVTTMPNRGGAAAAAAFAYEEGDIGAMTTAAAVRNSSSAVPAAPGTLRNQPCDMATSSMAVEDEEDSCDDVPTPPNEQERMCIGNPNREMKPDPSVQ